MKVESLAVTYRPKKLIDLVGQDHIVSQIKGIVKKGRTPSSIMLHGPTGLGKTTVARMLASIFNCANLDKETCNPCGECPSCLLKEHPDVVEMNMANSRGIDDVRAMIQQSNNMPTYGNKRIFILDEFQQITPQGAQACLKSFEESPPNTIWIICTMSPDKVLPAIAKRCLSLQVRPVEPELIQKRLYRIAKREGLDFKTLDDGAKLLKMIADFANGGMRESITLLESVLLGFHSGESLDSKTVLTKYLSGTDADLDIAAVNLLVAVLAGDLKLLIKAVPADNARGVLNKTRWLIDYLINNSIGTAKFTPYSGRLFAKSARDADVKVTLSVLLQLQNLLLEIEWKLNTMSVDERVVFMSMVGNFTVGRMKNA